MSGNILDAWRLTLPSNYTAPTAKAMQARIGAFNTPYLSTNLIELYGEGPPPSSPGDVCGVHKWPADHSGSPAWLHATPAYAVVIMCVQPLHPLAAFPWLCSIVQGPGLCWQTLFTYSSLFHPVHLFHYTSHTHHTSCAQASQAATTASWRTLCTPPCWGPTSASRRSCRPCRAC